MQPLYSRVFVSILDSSIAENWQVRHVFEDFLKLADDGILDMTREAFARKTNMPLDVVNAAIDCLEEPDPNSRDPAEQGRRILRLDAHRNWGWRIVNWDKYAQIKKIEHQRAQNRQRVQRHRDGKRAQGVSPTPLPPEQIRADQNRSEVMLPDRDTPLQAITAEDIFEAYPLKVAKPSAVRAIEGAMAKTSPGVLLARTREFARALNGDTKFCPEPAKWFAEERYNDDSKTWKPRSSEPPKNDVRFEL